MGKNRSKSKRFGYCDKCKTPTKWLIEFVGVWERHTCDGCGSTKLYKTQ